jgi:hypothetical protein
MTLARKKINAATQSDNDKALRFLRNETRAMSAARHQNLIALIGICIEQGELSLLMEYAEFGTLRERLDEDPSMPVLRRFGLMRGITNGARALHAHTPEPIIHGDLKSLNVLITTDAATGRWIAKISDFGLATTGSGLTTTGGTKATGLSPSHSPPEVLGAGATAETTTASDIYSLGIVIWEVVTGLVPFEGMTPMQVLSGVCMRSERPPLPAAPPPGSVFDAAQWALFTEHLLPGGEGAAPGGCWAQDAAERPTITDIAGRFDAAVRHFEAPERAAAATGLSADTIAQALAFGQRAEGAAGTGMLLSRFSADAKMLRTGEVEEGADGIWLALGVEEGGERCLAIQRDGCAEIEREFREGGQDDPPWMAEAGKHDGLGSDWARFEYVRKARAKMLVQRNGAARDAGGNSGKALGDFMKHPHAGKLKQAHVLALRLYTSNSYPRINDPLRQGAKPHPFAATTYFIYDALRKLRSLRRGEATAGKTFWRGMSNMGVGEGFLKQGGTEMACMSTTEDEGVARTFAKVRGAHNVKPGDEQPNPLLLKVEAGNMYDCGADLQWLSMYPDEKEVLFPPLTYMKATHIAGAAVGSHPPDCTIITVTPRF